MSFRTSKISLCFCMVLSLALPGCCTSEAVRAQISKWPIWAPRRTPRRGVARPTYLTPSYPKTACPEGPWPNGLPKPEPDNQSLVVPAPEPDSELDDHDLGPTSKPNRDVDDQEMEDEKPLSQPLPSPPRLPIQARNSRARNPVTAPPVPDSMELEGPVEEPQTTQQRIPGLSPVPELTDEPEFVPQREADRPRLPQMAERLEPHIRSRQPVSLEAPEVDLSPDPFEGESNQNPAELPDSNLPPPTFESFDDEDLELTPVPPPAAMDSPIETQSLQIRRQDLNRTNPVRQQGFTSHGLPPHSATNDESDDTTLRVVQLSLVQENRAGERIRVDPKSLRSGQNILVRAEFAGVKYASANREFRSRVTYHLEIQGAEANQFVGTVRQLSEESVLAPDGHQELNQLITVPQHLAAGVYKLTLKVRDEISGVTSAAELPIRIQ